MDFNSQGQENDSLRSDSLASKNSTVMSGEEYDPAVIKFSDVEQDGDEIDPNEYLEEQRRNQSKQRKVARIVPAFIDLIILVAQLAMFGGYTYMAFFYNGINNKCYASTSSKEPFVQEPGYTQLGIDVGKNFRMAIRWGFAMTFMLFFRAILVQVAFYLKLWYLLWISYVLFAANISLFLILFTFMQVWRWSHAGRVCSGDFLLDRELKTDRPNYLITEGLFLQAILLIIYSIFGLALLSICVAAVCVKAKQRRNSSVEGLQDSVTLKGSVLSDSQRRIRVTAFNQVLDSDYEHAMRASARSSMLKSRPLVGAVNSGTNRQSGSQEHISDNESQGSL